MDPILSPIQFLIVKVPGIESASSCLVARRADQIVDEDDGVYF
jgi:hypothetical protein